MPPRRPITFLLLIGLGCSGKSQGTGSTGGTAATTTGASATAATGTGITAAATSGVTATGATGTSGGSTSGTPVFPDGGECTPAAGDSFPPLPDSGPVLDSGVSIACLVDGGTPITGVDAAIAALAPGSWLDLPCTEMANVCPMPYDYYACGAVMDAWSGGAYDTVNDRLIVFGGGHTDSWINSVFTFDLGSATWKRWTDLPLGVDGADVYDSVYTDIRIESCGLYPSVGALCIPDSWLSMTGYVDTSDCDQPGLEAQMDPQQPRSRHTYGNVAFSAATGRFYGLGGAAMYQSGQNPSERVDGFDFSTGQWVRGADNTDVGYGTSATDGQGRIWYVGSLNLDMYDPTADAWTQWPGEGQSFTTGQLYGYYGSADVDTTRNVMVLTSDGQDLETYVLADGGLDLVTATGLSATLPSEAGMAYDHALDRFVWWNGGQTLYFLNPATWVWTEVQGGGADPGGPSATGTFGRFRYSPTRDVFVAVSGTDTDVFIYKPPATAP